MSRRSLRTINSITSTVAEVAKPTTPKKATKTKDAVKEELESSEVAVKKKASTKAATKGPKEEVTVEVSATEIPKKKATKRASKKSEPVDDDIHESSQDEDEEPKPKVKAAAKRKSTKDDGDSAPKKRKTKEEKEAEALPLAVRTPIPSLKKPMYIGAHVSGAGGVQNSIPNAQHIGGNSFALFLKSQRKWSSPPLAPEARSQFHAFCKEHNYDAAKHVLPHGSYLVNLAQSDADKAEQAYTCFLDDLQRCEALGIQLYNFHPGNTGSNPRPEAIKRIATQLNKAHKATKTVITVLENMAGAGNVIGSTFEDLRDIIALIDDKSRVGVCIDTCHTFAAGYDLRSPEAFKKTMDEFADIVGISYLKALHLNDSKTPLGSNRDLHANIGTGFLGLSAFYNVMNYEPFQGMPMVLETPIDKKGADGKAVEDKGVWAVEIKLLESLIGADVEGEEFRREEERLQEAGKEERAKFQKQVDKKTEKMVGKSQKSIKDMFKGAGKGKKAKKEEEEESGDESEGGCKH